jgi:ArsR family transcriptional regulator
MDPVLFYKSLADETRLRVLMLIEQEGELCVCELTEALSLSQPKISRHLAQLREVNVLLTRRAGQWVYYRLNEDLPNWALSVLKTTLRENEEWLDQNNKALRCMQDRPVRTNVCG